MAGFVLPEDGDGGACGKSCAGVGSASWADDNNSSPTNAVAFSSASANAQNARAAPAQEFASTWRFDICDFAVRGAAKIRQLDVEEAIYFFLWPNKSSDNVERICAAGEGLSRQEISERQRISAKAGRAGRGQGVVSDEAEGRSAAGQKFTF